DGVTGAFAFSPRRVFTCIDLPSQNAKRIVFQQRLNVLRHQLGIGNKAVTQAKRQLGRFDNTMDRLAIAQIFHL
ncbi:hypothetical protein H4F55_22340, partial [Pectobacterium brasiliense]|nr:hypothetical protein [Pectobacterium brasiliense]